MVERRRYRGFISYSQHDKAWGARLHRWLETYRVPLGVMVGLEAKRRLGRFFRDDDEMAATADIAEQVRTSIDESESLIVICSPRSAQSRWVDAEIRQFRATGRGRNVFAFIIDGVPNSGDPATECFPPSLRASAERLAERQEETSLPLEPLGIDVRVDGRDRSCARLAAGLLGVDFDALWQRDRRRRALRAGAAIGIAFAVLSAYAILLAMQTRSLNGNKSTFLAQLAQLQSDAVASFMDEDQGQYDRAVRFGMLATQPGILHPQPEAARDELARALHAIPTSLRLNAWNEPVQETILSPGGTRLATARLGGLLTLFDIPTTRIIARFDTKIPKIVGGAFHPLRNWLALNSNDGILHVFNLDTQKELLATPQMPVRIHVAEFSFDGRYLLVGGADRYQVWDLSAGGAAVDSYIATGKTRVHQLRWLPWKLQIGFLRDQMLVIRDPIARQDVATFGDEGHSVHDFDVNRAGSRLYLHERVGPSTSDDHNIVFVDLEDFKKTYSKPITPAYFHHFRLTDNESHVITVRNYSSGEGNREVMELFDLRYAGKQPLTLASASQSSIRGVTPAPGHLAVVRYGNGVTRLWSHGTGPYGSAGLNEEAKVQAHDSADVLATFYLPLTKELITHGGDGSVVLWDLKSYGNVVGAAPYYEIAEDMAFSRDGKGLLASSYNHVAVIALKLNEKTGAWSGEQQQVLHVGNSSRIKVKSAYFTPAEDAVVIYLDNGEIARATATDAWKVSVVARIAPIRVTTRDTKSGRVAIGAADGVYLHESDGAGAPVKLGDVAGEIAFLALSPDGLHLAAGLKDGGLTSWNLQTRKVEFNAKDAHSREVVAVTFTPDSRRLAYSRRRGPMRLLSVGPWQDADLGRVNAAYQYVDSFQFSPDGRTMYLEAVPRDTSGLVRDIGLLNLADLAFTDFAWRDGDYETWEFIGADRLLTTFSSGELVARITSPATKKVLATKHHNEYGHAAAFDPNDNKIAVSGYRRILLWSAGWANELRTDEIRRKVCAGAMGRLELVVTDRDARRVPMLGTYVGKNVCELGGGRATEKLNLDVHADADTPTKLLERFGAIGSPKLLTSDALREYLVYFPFDTLLKVHGKQAARAKLLAASGYASGIAVEKDVARAESLYSELAQEGMAVARHNLAMMLEGREGDAQRSRELMAQAAEQGFWMSNRALGLAAQKAGNAQEAKFRFQKAVKAGDGTAVVLLARMADEARPDAPAPSPEACDLAREHMDLMNFASMLISVDCLRADQSKDRDLKELAARILLIVASQDVEPAARSEARSRLDRMRPTD